jgi:CheY-like chemotaxis protein
MGTSNKENLIHNHQKIKVLFVDDNDLCRRLMKKLFSRINDLEAELAVDGNEALLLTMQNKYDIIFMDIQLPHINGYEVTRKIRKREALQGVYTPIIAVTACVGIEDIIRCSEAGMDDFIPKPINTENLLSKIRQYSDRNETFA